MSSQRELAVIRTFKKFYNAFTFFVRLLQSATLTHAPIMHFDVVDEEEVDPKRQVDHIAHDKTTVRDFHQGFVAPCLADNNKQPCYNRGQYTPRRVRCFRALVAQHHALHSRIHTLTMP